MNEIQIPESIQVQHRVQSYYDLALQYYILARQGVICHSMPVAGNLAHHAIEMLLHAGLSKKHTFNELERKYHKHNLVPMWVEFKELFFGIKLEKYNKVIGRYNKWEEIRFPRARKSNIIMFFDIRKGKESKMNNQKDRRGEEYRINLEELDEFFKSVTLLFINPEYVKTILFGEQLNVYTKDNYHIVWQNWERVFTNLKE